jgi:hypothetical protein
LSTLLLPLVVVAGMELAVAAERVVLELEPVLL